MSTTTDRLLDVAEEVLRPLKGWAHQCHSASIQLVRSGVLAPCRVARGSGTGVGAQHSWVVLGDNCYDEDATIVDPTLWSYDPAVDGIWVGTYKDGLHTPFGRGSIWQWGRPENAAPGEEIELTPRKPWSSAAQTFIDMLGPLDRRGWAMLAHAPVEQWPAAEIIDAMCESGFEAVVPIDIVGMNTDRNPSGLYLAEEA